MITIGAPFLKYPNGLALADGSTWSVSASDAFAEHVVSHLVRSMHLCPLSDPERRLLVLSESIEENRMVSNGLLNFIPSGNEGTTLCVLKSGQFSDTLVPQLMQLSLIFCRHSEIRGGMLLHGALCEWKGLGVILAGRGGVGKTTASRRLLPPWQPLSDDATLVVRNQQGEYWAHPWPTWGRVRSDGTAETWNVQRAVPLKGIFFLEQGGKDRVDPVGAGHAVCLLVELVEYWSWSMPILYDMETSGVREARLLRFNNICALVKALPCYMLHLGLTGRFWLEVEGILSGGTDRTEKATGAATQNIL